MICAFIVMKTEGFPMITELVDYWTFERFLKNIDHAVLSELM